MIQGTSKSKSAEMRAYRRHIVERGRHQLVIDLPKETVAYLDEVKVRQGLRSRSEVLAQLIERGREATR